MLPAEWGQVGKQMIGHFLGLSQDGDRALQVPRVPQDDGGDQQVEAGEAMLLVFSESSGKLFKHYKAVST